MQLVSWIMVWKWQPTSLGGWLPPLPCLCMHVGMASLSWLTSTAVTHYFIITTMFSQHYVHVLLAALTPVEISQCSVLALSPSFPSFTPVFDALELAFSQSLPVTPPHQRILWQPFQPSPAQLCYCHQPPFTSLQLTPATSLPFPHCCFHRSHFSPICSVCVLFQILEMNKLSQAVWI